MVGWHHWLNGHEFEQTLGDSGGQSVYSEVQIALKRKMKKIQKAKTLDLKR